MRTLTLTCYGDAGDLTPNRVAKMHWGQVGRRKEEWKNRAIWTWKVLNEEPFAGKVRIDCEVYRFRKMDVDNVQKSLALKAIVDGLVEAGALADDGPRYVVSGTTEVQFGSREPRVDITITEVP